MVLVFLNLLAILLAFLSLESVISHGVQPLSLIDIHKAVIAIDDQAYIRASPLVLGVNVSFYHLLGLCEFHS